MKEGLVATKTPSNGVKRSTARTDTECVTLKPSVDNGEGFPNVSKTKKRTGRIAGNENIAKLDKANLLDITEKKLPIGSNASSMVFVDYNAYETACGRCHRGKNI